MLEYKAVLKETQKEIIEKKSRFIANIKPVENEEEALIFVSQIKSRYWDATHNVYAYSLYSENIQRYSDDGEPQGTAGIPTLQAIKNLELNDVAVVVTRYFGGTLLGAGGLVRTYGKCAKEGLIQAQIITKRMCTQIEFEVDYSLLGKVQNEIFSMGYIIGSIIYKENVHISVLLPFEEISRLNKAIENVICSKLNIDILGEKLILTDNENNLIKI